MDRFNNQDNTAPVVDPINSPDPKVPRSRFDFSRINIGNANIGPIIPIDFIKTLPNEDYDLSYDVMLLARNPLSRRLLSGMRVYVHSYYIENENLWEGWKNYITRGRSGASKPQFPLLYPRMELGFTSDSALVTAMNNSSKMSGSTDQISFYTPTSLADYIGVPNEVWNKMDSNAYSLPYSCGYSNGHPGVTNNVIYCDNDGSSSKLGINALPFAMYQKVYRDFYMNKNICTGLKYWFPDDEDEQILPYDCNTSIKNIDMSTTGIDPLRFSNGYVNNLNRSNPCITSASIYDKFGTPDVNGLYYNPYNDNEENTDWLPMDLRLLRFRQFKGDYFTSSSPFVDLIRGSIPDLAISGLTGTINFDETFETTSSYTDWYLGYSSGTDKLQATGYNRTSAPQSISESMLAALNRAKVTVTANNITMKALRELQAYTVFKEKMGRSDGMYNTMIKNHFGYNPHSHDRKAKYIGGFYQDINFSEVVQTSESSDTNYLGRTGARASSANRGTIGHYHSPDYGYIMTVMSIVPDTIYSQGVDKFLTTTNQDDEYFPIFNNLAPQPVLLKELYCGDGSDQLTDEQRNTPFGFVERFSEYKSRRNRASGLIGAKGSVFDNALTMRRNFTSSPTLSANFLNMCPQNIDMSVFASNEIPFDFEIGCNVSKVSPMPFVTVPDENII